MSSNKWIRLPSSGFVMGLRRDRSSWDYATTGRHATTPRQASLSADDEVDPRSLPSQGQACGEVCCEDCEYSTAAVWKGEMVFTCDHAKSGQRLIVNADDRCEKFVRSRDLIPPHLVQALAEGAKLIPLTQGHFAIVDAADYEWLNQYKWHVKKDKNKYYAESQKNRKSIKMHRLITGAPDHLFVDHRDHNGLNNRRWNLRQCSRAENIHNQRPQQGGTSKYKGVCWSKCSRKYVSQIGMNGTRKTVGYFHDEIEAAVAYDLKAMEVFGEFAYLNFPALMRRYEIVNSDP